MIPVRGVFYGEMTPDGGFRNGGQNYRINYPLFKQTCTLSCQTISPGIVTIVGADLCVCPNQESAQPGKGAHAGAPLQKIVKRGEVHRRRMFYA